MKENDDKIDETELRNAFSGFKSVQKSDLRNFYIQHSQAATEQSFRRFLYRLEKLEIIAPIGAGVYAFHGQTSALTSKKKRFSPNWSQELGKLNEIFQKTFPYARYLIWETRVLHEFMLLQPGQNFFILETEKDVCESAFNLLSSEYSDRTFLDPTRATMERYILPHPDSILISRLVTESPKRTVQGIPFPKLEKILVDIFAEEDIYYFFRGEELARIFENAFSTYLVSEKTLFRYARRRKVSAKLRQFIRGQTQIELSVFPEDAA
jgi:hypothetical protein